MRNELINYRIQNNTSSIIPSSLWTPSSTTTNTANAVTRYTWDLNGVNLSSGTASFTINGVTNNLVFDGTLQGLVNALNELNYGYFLVSGDTMYTQDDTNVYGNFVSPPNSPYPYIYGSPQLVFDFSDTTSYQNSGTSIADLSGNGNNGIFTQGTGNGSPFTVTGYDSTNGWLNLPGDANELSVRLPNSLKYSGTGGAFTYIMYCKPLGYGYSGNFASGLISNSYSPGLTNQGVKWVILNNSTSELRYDDGGSPSGFQMPDPVGGGIGAWTMYVLTNDGTTETMYQMVNGVSYKLSANITSPATPLSGWGLYMGLSYNVWFKGYVNYAAIYDSVCLTESQLLTIYNQLLLRGY